MANTLDAAASALEVVAVTQHTPFASLATLAAWQDEHRAEFYATNLEYWETGRHPSDASRVMPPESARLALMAMTGDGEAGANIADSRRFLEALLRLPRLRPSSG